jgi:hypothetical protein
VARLPVPGSDNGAWGTVLNDYLSVEHNADGTLSHPLSVKKDGTSTGSPRKSLNLMAGSNVTISATDNSGSNQVDVTISAATTGGAGIPETIVGAKGDLIAGTGDDTVTRLPVGSIGQALTADPNAGTGLRWATISNEVLWSSDPRVGLVPNDSADQLGKLQTFLDLMTGSAVAADRVGYLIPGVYRKNGELKLNNTDGNKPVRLIGGGGKVAETSPTTIIDTADAGAGKWALNVVSVQGTFTIEHIAFHGSFNPPTLGSVDWQMRGVKLPTRCRLYDVSVQGYFCGFGVLGDHIYVEDFACQGNTFNIEVPPMNPTQGDIVFRVGQAGSAGKASIGVASSSTLGGASFHDVELSLSPYCIMRYSDGLGQDVTSAWISGVEILRAATEYTGSGILYDDVGNGAGIGDMVFDHGVTNWGLYTDQFAWPSKPRVAAWYNSGSIGNVQFVNSLPAVANGLPSLKAGALIGVTYAGQSGNVVAALDGGARYYELINPSGQLVSRSYSGDNRGNGSVLMQPYVMASGSVVKGELLTNNNEFDVLKYAGPVNGQAKQVVAVAAHSASAGQVVHAYVSGNQSGLQVKNTSGTTITGGSLLVPHPNGGVAAVGATWSGQVIGRALYTINDGALGELDLYIR